MLWHIYPDRRLLAEIRQEIDRYVKVVSPKSELPIAEPDHLDMDMEGLYRSCPLLKASYFETMRLDVQGTTYKSVTADFTVTESPEDAAIVGKSKPRTYKLSKGQFVCVPHSVHQRDARYFKDPAAFNPKRFYVIDKENPDEIAVEMGTMHPFGGGPNMCKGKLFHAMREFAFVRTCLPDDLGQHFAEREVLAFAAAILATWDMEPVDGKWVHPGAKQGSGTVNPVKDVRVRMMRRQR
jgi:cytochrome P450